MRRTVVAALLLGVAALTLTAVGVAGDSAHSSAHVVPLNDADWDETPGVGESTRGEVLVNFYAPWCGQCKLLAPVWATVGHVLHLSASPLLVASVDCTLNPEVCADMNINGYPTILFFRDGQRVAQYDGDRTLQKIVDWAQTKSIQPRRALVVPPTDTAKHTKTAAATPAPAPAADSGSSGTCSEEGSCSYPQTVLNQLKELLRRFVADPTRIVVQHPVACIALVYLVGVMHGAFAGVVWALREQSRIARAIPAAALGPIPAHAHPHQQ